MHKVIAIWLSLTACAFGIAGAQERALQDFTAAFMTAADDNSVQIKALAKAGNPNARLWVIRMEDRADSASDATKQKARDDLEAMTTLDTDIYMYDNFVGGTWPLAGEAAFLIAEDYLTEGLLYLDDMKKALEWLRQAAGLGHPVAMYKMSGRYTYGIGVAKDPVRAQEWLIKAKSAGHRQAAIEIFQQQKQ